MSLNYVCVTLIPTKLVRLPSPTVQEHSQSRWYILFGRLSALPANIGLGWLIGLAQCNTLAYSAQSIKYDQKSFITLGIGGVNLNKILWHT